MDVGPPGTSRPLYWVLVLLSLIPLGIVLPMAPTKVGIAIIAGWTALIWIAVIFVRGQFHYVVLMWVAVYPYCYYLLSYPAERSIFTVDRALIILSVIEMLVFSRQAVAAPLARDVRISAYFWGLYLLVCFLSLAGHDPSEVLPSYRLLVDGMLIPALLGLYAMRYFPLPKDLRKLHVCACILGIGLCITGLVEMTMDIDLFPWKGAAPTFTDTHVRRPDGPFEQQIALSMVAILGFFFVIYLRRLMPQRISPWQELLHKVGSIASLGAAFLPLNRGLVFALAPIAVIDSCSKSRLISRRLWAAFFAIILLTVITAKLLDPLLYEERVSRPDNFYQRLAQDQETLRVVRAYPFFGVGLGLYHDVAAQDPRYLARWNGIESMNLQHNALMTVLSEDGIVGLLFYVLAQVFFIRAMWRIRKAYRPGWLVFLYCLLIYVLIGLDFATVYFSDINLLLIFILGVVFQMQTRLVHQQEFATSCS
jgi:O-Antigen ligase